MTIFIIIEYYSFENLEEVVAVCDSYASAIQWLIENKGLTKDYSQYNSVYSRYWTLEDFYGKNWLKVMTTLQEMKYFHLDDANYAIEEKEIFSKKPLDI